MPAPLLVLVHSPVLGAGSWYALADCLRARDYDVVIPDIAAAVRSVASAYRNIARVIATSVEDHHRAGRIVLIGHSGAGAVLPVAAEALGCLRTQFIFLDAVLPHPGRSWFDTVPVSLQQHLRGLSRDGFVPAWNAWWPPAVMESLLPDADMRQKFAAELQPSPLVYFEDKAPDIPLPESGCCTYVQMSPGYDGEAQSAENLGWDVRRMALDHLAILTTPEPVADAIERIIVTR